MKKIIKRIVIALCALLSVATFALASCSAGNNESTLPPSTEQGETSGDKNEEQEITEENPTDESKPSIPGGLVDGGEFSGNKT
ncbi:MAG: hypothetical protein ACI4QI_08875 [Candidatus Coproplasma sp.]